MMRFQKVFSQKAKMRQKMKLKIRLLILSALCKDVRISRTLAEAARVS